MDEAIKYNPDILSCLASLSNDEVFTPPNMVNDMLDMLPSELWRNKKAKFLDPCCKSGVFLREITKRLVKGLEKEIPNLQQRINHILSNQLYGIAITELTALLSRRTVYCSKNAIGEFSICGTFFNERGNIFFDNIEHTWVNDKCKHCGASKTYDRGSEMESHAYAFIHEHTFNEVKNMKFDVIIGNPPYQMSDGGNKASAKPIYHDFVIQGKKLSPRYLTMIIPSRWFAGGKGLTDFRNEMFKDRRIKILHDFFDSNECFPGVDISGGVCYFLWDRDNPGDCKIINHLNGNIVEKIRPMVDENDTFIRFNEAVSIFKKVKTLGENSFSSIMSPRKPFGITTDVLVHLENIENSTKIYAYPKNGYVEKTLITQNIDAISKYKVLISYAYGERGCFPYFVIGKPFVAEPGTCCSETYVMIGSYCNEIEPKNVISYMTTKFFRFLVLMKKNTQHATREVYSLVPIQDFNIQWDDEKLCKKYNLTEKEVDFINKMIKPMEQHNE